MKNEEIADLFDYPEGTILPLKFPDWFEQIETETEPDDDNGLGHMSVDEHAS